jgi:hypothetical protein
MVLTVDPSSSGFRSSLARVFAHRRGRLLI